MKKKITAIVATLLAFGIAHGKISPANEAFEIFESSVRAFARTQNVRPQDLQVSWIIKSSPETVTIVANGTECVVLIEKQSTKPGIAGSMKIVSTVDAENCIPAEENYPSLPFSQIRRELTKTANDGKTVSAVQVLMDESGQAKVDLKLK